MNGQSDVWCFYDRGRHGRDTTYAVDFEPINARFKEDFPL
jgi:hypothetical protein